MKERLRQLERLKGLRDAQQRMCEAELAREQIRLREAREIEASALAAREAEQAFARAALLNGDVVSRRLSEAGERLCASWHADCEGRVVVEAARVKAAQGRLRESRVRREQSSTLAAQAAQSLAADEGRRWQAGSDERFAARAHWNARRLGMQDVDDNTDSRA